MGVEHRHVQDLLNGNFGSPQGTAIARFLESTGRREVINDFYTWVYASSARNPMLCDWLEDNHPELHTWYKARKRVT